MSIFFCHLRERASSNSAESMRNPPALLCKELQVPYRLILNNLQNHALHVPVAMLACFPVPPIRQRQAAGPLTIDPPQFLSLSPSQIIQTAPSSRFGRQETPCKSHGQNYDARSGC